MIKLEELAETVDRVGLEAAAAELGMSSSQVKRWLNGQSTIPGTREKAVRTFIAAHARNQAKRPLGSYSVRELLDEIEQRLDRDG